VPKERRSNTVVVIEDQVAHGVTVGSGIQTKLQAIFTLSGSKSFPPGRGKDSHRRQFSGDGHTSGDVGLVQPVSPEVRCSEDAVESAVSPGLRQVFIY
jgi:hypothetical protein